MAIVANNNTRLKAVKAFKAPKKVPYNKKNSDVDPKSYGGNMLKSLNQTQRTFQASHQNYDSNASKGQQQAG